MTKTKLKLKPIFIRVIVAFMLFLMPIIVISTRIFNENNDKKEIKNELKVMKNKEKDKENDEKQVVLAEKEDEVINEELEVTQDSGVAEEYKEPEISVSSEVNSVFYRLTSFYTDDGYDTTSCTGSGLCEWDFGINDKGWYTYNGYLVLAGATTYLQSRFGVVDGRHYFKYYDTVSINIDGVNYDGIILDSCGASMYVSENRLDLFVSSGDNAIDRGYRGNNMVSVVIN